MSRMSRAGAARASSAATTATMIGSGWRWTHWARREKTPCSGAVSVPRVQQSACAEDAQRGHERERDEDGHDDDGHAGGADALHQLGLEDQQAAERDGDGQAGEDHGAPGRVDRAGRPRRRIMARGDLRRPACPAARARSSSRNRLTTSSP